MPYAQPVYEWNNKDQRPRCRDKNINRLYLKGFWSSRLELILLPIFSTGKTDASKNQEWSQALKIFPELFCSGPAT